MSKAKILIVDDVKINRDMLAGILEDDYETYLAADGQEAIDLFEQGADIQLLLLDLAMPRKNGFDVLHYMKEKDLLPQIPVIVETGLENLEDEVRAFNMGAADLVQKPYVPEIILRKMENLLALYGSRRNLQQMLHHSRKYDPISGFLNRTEFFESATRMLQGVPEEEWSEYTVIVTNIRNFRYYNIHYGMDRGNEVLKQLSLMLADRMENTFLSRLESDHFAVITKADRRSIEKFSKSIQQEFYQRYGVFGMQFCAGSYTLKGSMDTIENACEYAKLACGSIRNAEQYYCCYDDEFARTLEIRSYVIRHLDEAIEKRYIQVYYQPVMRTLTGALCGAEALARWIDPEMGFLSPADFIPVLEENLLITRVDLYILESVCAQMKEDEEKGLAIVPVSINLSRIDFMEIDILQEVERITAKYGVSHDLIRIELTESMVMEDEALFKEKIEQFRNAGYQTWMDDFGSEYSSLNALKQFSFDEIKLDMKFMSAFDEKSREIIRSVIRMAKNLGIKTLAEGVETEEQYKFLRDVGCEKVQGYYFSRPLPLSELKQKMQTGVFKIEKPMQQQYFDQLAAIDFAVDQPMAVFEYDGEAFHTFFINELLSKTCESQKIRDIQKTLDNACTEQNEFWRRYTAHLQHIHQDHIFYTMDFAYQDITFRFRTRCIARYQKRMLCEMTLQTLGQISTNIQDIIDVQKITDAMKLWSTACNMATICLDADGEYVTGQIGFTDFCMKYTRGTRDGAARCLNCDRSNENVYRCHAGLMDFGFDILLDNGQIVGRIIGGQVLSQPIDEAHILTLADELGIPQDEYLEAAQNVPIRDAKSIRASAYLLEKIINDLVNTEYNKQLQERYIREMDNLSRRDSLTGLYNNKYCTNYIDTLIFEQRRFALYLLEISGYKSERNVGSRLFGAAVLSEVSAMMRELIPDTVIAARYGDDQFALVIPMNDMEEIEREYLIDAIRRGVEILRFEENPDCILTVRSGSAVYPEDGMDVKALYISAEEDLYAGKQLEEDVSNSLSTAYRILDHLPGMVVVFIRNLDGTISRGYASKPTLDFMGAGINPLETQEEIMGYIYEEDRQWVQRKLVETVRAGEGADLIYRMVDCEGEVHWMHHMAKAFPQLDGTCRFYAIYEDVTAQKNIAGLYSGNSGSGMLS